MSNNPVVKQSRQGLDARYCDPKDLSFSSEIKTPKIFKGVITSPLSVSFLFQGAITPAGANGNYMVNGEYAGYRSFTNGNYWIWWDNPNNRWVLTNTKGSGTVIFYQNYVTGYHNSPRSSPLGWWEEGTGDASYGGYDRGYFSKTTPFETLPLETRLGYVPSFMGFRRLSPDTQTQSGGFDIDQWTHAQQAAVDYYTDSGVYIRDGELCLDVHQRDDGLASILFLDPISGIPPSEYNSRGGGMILLSNGEVDVRTAFPTDLSIDSRFDTFKVFKSGTITLNLPAETLYANQYSIYTEKVEHNLGYPPVYLPEAPVNWYVDGYSDFIVNDNLDTISPADNDDVNALDVYVDSNDLVMRFRRNGGFEFMDEQFPNIYPACTITMYYTIFYNEIGDNFDLLDI